MNAWYHCCWYAHKVYRSHWCYRQIYKYKNNKILLTKRVSREWVSHNDSNGDEGGTYGDRESHMHVIYLLWVKMYFNWKIQKIKISLWVYWLHQNYRHLSTRALLYDYFNNTVQYITYTKIYCIHCITHCHTHLH